MAEGLGSFTFTELHLLPRIVFAIGAAFFVGGLFHSNPFMTNFGLGVLFVAAGYNCLFDFFLNLSTKPPENSPRRFHKEREALVLHALFSFIIAGYCFYTLYEIRQGTGSVPFLFQIWGS